MPTLPEPQDNTPELETRVVEDTPPAPETDAQRVARQDKEWQWMKESMLQLRRSQAVIESHLLNQMGFSTPQPGTPSQMAAPMITVTEHGRPERGFTSSLGRPPEALLPNPTFPPRVETPPPRVDHFQRRAELPLFEGHNPDDWLFRLEKCFAINQTPEYEKLDQAVGCLTGIAIPWWRNSHGREQIQNWKDFKEKFKIRFRPSRGSSAMDQLFNLKQTGSVDEYRNQFESITVELLHLTNDVLESAFLKGLKKNIADQVVRCRPVDLNDIVEIARLIEAQEEEQSGYKVRTFPRNTMAATSSQTVGYNKSNETIPARKLFETGKDTRRTTTVSDRTFNPCRHCGDKWFPGHKCKQPRFKYMELDEEGNPMETSEEIQGEPETDPELEVVGEQELHTLSSQSVKGFTTEQALIMKGKIANKEVIVLVDSGATSNFISEKVVKELGITVSNTKGFGVKIADGHIVQGKGKCTGVLLEIQGVEIMEEFLLFELGSTDVVLGFKWLATLGDTRTNWGRLTLSWRIRDHWVTIKGDPSLSKGQVSLNSMEKVIGNNGEVYLLELSTLFESQEDQDKKIGVAEVQAVLEKHQTVLDMPRGLPPKRNREHAITLYSGTPPINTRPYRYSYTQKNEIEKLVQEMLEAKIIQPSISPYSSPVLLVKKKDGGWRFCVDYRALNKATVPDRYPIPVIEELLDELNGAAVFSKLDLKSGYHQIRMKCGDVEKTAFKTHQGHYEFLVMPFGLTNAPSTFQSVMNDLFRPYLRKFVLVFFDDVLVYSPDLKAHLRHLDTVLGLMKQHQFYVNAKKCSFGNTRISYLGHIISAQGVAADPEKIEAMLKWPEPKNITELRGFLGLTGYYRRFVMNYGQRARALTELLKKNSFEWSATAAEAFKDLKLVVTSLPVLRLPDFTKEFTVETDASGEGIGAVLSQDKRPIAFISQAFSSKGRIKSVYERELLAIVKAVTKWKHYLTGREFVIKTDQRSLRHLLDQKAVSTVQQRWAAKLLGLTYRIEYKPGVENKVADALSRRPPEEQLSQLTLTAPLSLDKSELLSQTEKDPELGLILENLQKGETTYPDYNMEQGLLYRKGCLVIPSGSPFIPKLLEQFHSSAIGGHEGALKTFKRLTQEVYWRGMRKDVVSYIKGCQVCQENKYATMSPAGLLSPLPIPQQIWADISMDFIEKLPLSKGFSVILVVVDRLSKYGHFIPLKHPFTAKSVVEVFVREVVKLHGFPETVISDRDKIFLSHFWSELFKLQGVALHRSSAYHPQTDGQTEVVNRCLETYLRCFANRKPTSWIQWLPWAEYWYNTSFHSSTQHTPFLAVYGREPPRLLRYGDVPTANAAVEELLRDRDSLLGELRENLELAQSRMQREANKHRRHCEYSVGNWVYLKLRPYRQKTVAQRKNEKLSPRYFGPYQVLERIGKVAYRLELPAHSQIHNVFHVSQLKAAVPATYTAQDIPPILSPSLEWIVEPGEVKDIRKTEGNRETEVLIQWHGLPAFEATWEPISTVIEQFPEFNLEDKVAALGGSIDRLRVPIQFMRKKPRSKRRKSRAGEKKNSESG